MQHTISREIRGVRLRPVTLKDASFIVDLRNSPSVLGTIGDSAKDIATQEDWLERYFERQNDYYFIIEVAGVIVPVGTISLYDINGDMGEWGRWIVRSTFPAGPASAWLALSIGFELLNLDALVGHVVAGNKRAIAFHQAIGNPYVGLSSEQRIIGGTTVSLLRYCARRVDWPKISDRLLRFAPDLSR